MKTKKSFLQKTIISILVAILLINFIIPVSMPWQYNVEAKTTGETDIEAYNALKNAKNGEYSNSIYEGPNGELGSVIEYDKINGVPTLKFEYYEKDGTKHSIDYMKVSDASIKFAQDHPILNFLGFNTWLEISQNDWVPNLDDPDYKMTIEMKNPQGILADHIQGDDYQNFGLQAGQFLHLIEDNGDYGIAAPNTGNTDDPVPNDNHTDEDTEYGRDVFGVLFDPLIDLLCSLGDLVINVLQWSMVGETNWQESNIFKLNMFLKNSKDFTSESDKSTAYTPRNGDGKFEGSSVSIDTDKFDKGWLNLQDDYFIPVTNYSPEQIFAGRVSTLDINFVNPNMSRYTDSEGKQQKASVSSTLHNTIASWYVALRNLAIVGLLSVLAYVGIRIIISSTASDKAKYKQMLTDWLIALCLLFFLHYIMSFTVIMVQSICDVIANGEYGENGSFNTITVNTTPDNITFHTNLLGLARFQVQYEAVGPKIAYLIMYLALVVYTVMFTIFYLKRVIMMAFLTLMAPLVALTYPIDKLQDGKAQAFDAWLKEYVYNALIQPFHLIIYMIFVGNAMDLAALNPVYMIVVLGFILPAERILRSFFGFDKAKGTLGALKTLGLASMAGKLLGGGSKGGAKARKGSSSENESEKPIRYQKGADYSGLELTGNSETEEDEEDRREEDRHGEDRHDEDRHDEDRHGEDRHGEDRHEEDRHGEDRRGEDRRGRRRRRDDRKSVERQNGELTPWDKARNLWRHHTDGLGRKIVTGTGKAITGVAKFGTRTAFKASAGALAAAVAAASGGGAAGALAAYSVASGLGGRAADGAINLVDGAKQIPQETQEFIDREIDIANGNNDRKEVRALEEKLEDEDRIRFLRDKMTDDAHGRIPTRREVVREMQKLRPYFENGQDNMKDITKAHNVANKRSISDERAAKYLAIIKERNIDAGVLNDRDDRAQYRRNLEKKLGGSMSKEQAKAVGKDIFKFADEFYGVKSNNK